MSFQEKIEHNIQVAEYCLESAHAICPGVSRAYYASYQCAKKFLLDHGVTEENYRTKAAGWGLDTSKWNNYSPFSHDTIWTMLKAYLKVARKGSGFTVNSGETLKKARVEADYTEKMQSRDDLRSYVKIARGIIKTLGDAYAH